MKKFNILFCVIHFSLGAFSISAHNIYRASIFEMILGKSIPFSFSSLLIMSLCFFPFYLILFKAKHEIIRSLVVAILLLGILLIFPWIYFSPDENMM